MVELDHRKPATQTLINKVRLNIHFMNILFILRNICFCASEMILFALEQYPSCFMISLNIGTGEKSVNKCKKKKNYLLEKVNQLFCCKFKSTVLLVT